MGNILASTKSVYRDSSTIFIEWNINPIIELNLNGEIIYLNLSARAQFPNIRLLSNKHPLLIGLMEEVADLPKTTGEMMMFLREISYQDYIYEQQVFMIYGVDSIFVNITDITLQKQVDNKINNYENQFKQYKFESENKIHQIKLQLINMQKIYRNNKERLHISLEAAEIGTWNWDIRQNIFTCDENMYLLLGIEKKIESNSLKNIMDLLSFNDKRKIIKDIEHCQRYHHSYHSKFNIACSDKSILQIEVRGKIYSHNHQPSYMAGVCFKTQPF